MGLGKNVDYNEVLNFNDFTIKSSKGVEILGIKINNHIKSVCRKKGQKLSAVLRISSNLKIRQNKIIN